MSRAYSHAMKHPAIGAVIFDMDGVLVDSEPLYLRATNQVLAREGFTLTAEDNARYIGWRFADQVVDMIGRGLLSREAEYYRRESLLAAESLFDQPIDPPPGAIALLDAVEGAGIIRAVGSSSSRHWVERMLTHLGIRERFHSVVCGDMVARGKPAPDIFQRCSELLRVPSASCLVIEDSPHGAEAARRAGMQVIGLRTTSTVGLDLGECLAVVEDLAECLDLLGLSG
ncbi:MAG: HAD family phosphatase [Chloroflexota bacterium]